MTNSVPTYPIIFIIEINCSVILRIGVFACWLLRCFVATEILNFFAPILVFVYYYIFQQHHWLLCQNNMILNISGWLLSKSPSCLLRCSVALFCLVWIVSQLMHNNVHNTQPIDCYVYDAEFSRKQRASNTPHNTDATHQYIIPGYRKVWRSRWRTKHPIEAWKRHYQRSW